MPDWKDLVARGLAGLDVALSEPTFAAHNGPQIKTAAIDEYRQQLQKFLTVRPIASCTDARDAVSWAAQLGHERLGIAASAVILEFLCGATNSLDPYSAYLTPNQLSEVYSQIEGNFVGIGVELKPVNGALNVVRSIPGSPAQQGGILAGDRIVAIGERWVRDCPPDQAANLLQGEAGTTVDVTVVTAEQPPRALRILRQRIEVPSIDDVRMADPQQGVAYLKLVCFQKTARRKSGGHAASHIGVATERVRDGREPTGPAVRKTSAAGKGASHVRTGCGGRRRRRGGFAGATG